MSAADPFDGKHLLKVSDLARYFGVRDHTVYQWKAKGHLPNPVRISGKRSLWWLRSDIENFLQEGIKK